MRDILWTEIKSGILGGGGDGDPEQIMSDRLASYHATSITTFEDRTHDGRHIQLVRSPAPDGHTVSVATDVTKQIQAEVEARKQTDTIELLHKVASDANQSQDIEAVLQACLDAVCAFTVWPVGHVYLRAPDGGDSGDVLLPTNIWHIDDPVRFAAFREVTEEPPLRQTSACRAR